jgi:predicted TIM-barrel fold metal-dependent hydrolase
VSFAVPAGAWDCHIHAIGAPARFPLAPDRGYTPAIVPIEDYIALMNRLGVAHAVIVQPSIYGTDNSAMVDALTRHPERFRGVAVVGADVDDATLDALHALGVRGVRANLLNPAGISFADALMLAPRIAARGWHLQLQIDVSTFDAFDALPRLPLPVVIDHFGYMAAAKGPDEPGFRRLLSLVEGAQCYVKLSSPYRLTPWRSEGYAAVTALARALVAANPERLLWASDWPHTDLREDMPDDGDLLDVLSEWVPDAAQRSAILVDNPVPLYGR